MSIRSQTKRKELKSGKNGKIMQKLSFWLSFGLMESFIIIIIFFNIKPQVV